MTAGCTASATAPASVDPGSPVLACPSAIAQLSTLGIPVPITYNLPTVTGGLPPLAGPICAPPSGTAFNQGSTSVTCTATDADHRVGNCSFTVSVAYPPKLAVTRFIAFGDSTTWGENGQSSLTTSLNGSLWKTLVQFPFADTYPGALQIDLVGRYTLQSPTVTNDGAAGEALLDPVNPAFTRFTAHLAPGTAKWDVVLIMEGANDLDQRDATIEPAMIAQLRGMINFARSVGVTPFIATLPPMNPAGCCPVPRGLGAALVPGFNDQVRALAMLEGAPLADVYQAFNGNLTLIGPDGLHPTADGYHLIAQTFFTVIQQTIQVAPTTTAAAKVKSLLRRPTR